MLVMSIAGHNFQRTRFFICTTEMKNPHYSERLLKAYFLYGSLNHSSFHFLDSIIWSIHFFSSMLFQSSELDLHSSVWLTSAFPHQQLCCIHQTDSSCVLVSSKTPQSASLCDLNMPSTQACVCERRVMSLLAALHNRLTCVTHTLVLCEKCHTVERSSSRPLAIFSSILQSFSAFHCI